MLPLEGVKVLELARVLAGPWCGQMLADLGADVIKVESPDGDDTRQWGPPFIGETAAYFHSCNRGKRSVTADFRLAEGRTLVERLVKDADILLENFKTGGLAKYGLDYESLSKINPGLIYCSITGFGQTGPDAHRAGYDYVVQGMCGVMSLTGDPDGEPQKVAVAITDILTGTYACSAALAALHGRKASGKGCHIDMSLLDVGLAMMSNQAMNALATGQPPKRIGNANPNLGPYQVLPCADGHFIIAVGNDGQFQRFCTLLGVPDLAHHPEYVENKGRVVNRAALSDKLGNETVKWTKADLLQTCEDHDVPAGPIHNMIEAFDEEQARFHDVATTTDGVPTVRSPFRIDGEPVPLRSKSPDLGSGQPEWLSE
jgi:crotonobetainyl-CoA:carnitine CoA-transferase CaiB-like acyl-CoA transferase